MKNGSILMLSGVFLAIAAADDVRGQLFGNRRSGSTASRRTRATFGRPSPFGRTGAGVDNQAGATVTGAERFFRGNRSVTDFVGADSTEQRSFVGIQQGETEGRITSAISTLRTQSSANANRGRKAPAQSQTEMYEPRLTIGFDFTPPPTQAIAADLARQLEATSSLRRLGRIEVSVQERTATLKGEVASERDRTLAGLMALFEPGISRVQNDLTVKAPPPTPPAPRPMGRDQPPAGPE